MIRAELFKVRHRRRTAALFGAAALFPVALTIALAAAGAGSRVRVGDIPLVLVPDHSGFGVALIAMSSTMRFFLPLLVAVVAGDTVASEAGSGRLRYALAAPVSRARILLAKVGAAAALSSALVVVFAAVSVLAGAAAFGWQPLAALDGDPSAGGVSLATFGAGAALGKLSISTLYVAAGLSSVFAFSLFLSALTSRPVIAVAGGAALTVVSRVFNGDYLPAVKVVSKYMPNTDIDLWQHLFVRPADTSGMGRFLLVQVAYVGVFSVAAWWAFTRRDVLT